jgi:hypothetical protein
MSGVSHDPNVPFAEEIVTGQTINLGSWECWTVKDQDVTRYYARGPCPACGAHTQGSIDDAPKPIESLGVREREPEPEPPSTAPISIPVSCRCGSPHGQAGQTSCGRRWVILAPRAT